MRRPNPSQGGNCNATCGGRIPVRPQLQRHLRRSVRVAAATPPAAAKSRSGRRLQHHLRRPNPSQGGGCNATCGDPFESRSGRQLQRHLRRPNPSQGDPTATPPAAAESQSGRQLQRHLRRPNPGQGFNDSACMPPSSAADFSQSEAWTTSGADNATRNAAYRTSSQGGGYFENARDAAAQIPTKRGVSTS